MLCATVYCVQNQGGHFIAVTDISHKDIFCIYRLTEGKIYITQVSLAVDPSALQ